MSPSQTDNRSKWQDFHQRTDFAAAMRRLGEYAHATATGGLRLCQYVSGPGGIGKSHLYRRSLKVNERPFVEMRNATKLGCLETFAEAVALKKLIYIEDPSRELLRDSEFWLILMAAADGIAYSSPVKGEERVFKLQGCQFVIQSNYALDSLRTKATEEIIEPFRSRIINVTLEASRSDLFKYACYLAICEDMLRLEAGANLERANIALAYFAEHRHMLSDVSPRGLVKIAKLIKQAPTMWEGIMRDGFLPSSSERPYVGDPPQIVL